MYLTGLRSVVTDGRGDNNVYYMTAIWIVMSGIFATRFTRQTIKTVDDSATHVLPLDGSWIFDGVSGYKSVCRY